MEEPSFIRQLEDILGLEKEVGLTLIRNAGLTPRILIEDNVPYVITRDYRLDRINIHIENGYITKAFVG